MVHSALDCQMHLFLRAHLILRNILHGRNECPDFTAEDIVAQGRCVLLAVSQPKQGMSTGSLITKPVLLPERLRCTLTTASSPSPQGTACAVELQQATHAD